MAHATHISAKKVYSLAYCAIIGVDLNTTFFLEIVAMAETGKQNWQCMQHEHWQQEQAWTISKPPG